MNTYLVTESNDFSEKFIYQTKHIPDEVENCYSFSSYLLEPDCRKFTEFARILVFVLEFINDSKIKSRKLPSDDQYKSEIKDIMLTDKETEASQIYLFQKQP